MKTLTKLETLIDLYPNQLWLGFSEEEKQENWKKSVNHSSDLARFQAYLNSLAAEIFIHWLEEEGDLETKPKIYFDNKKLNSIWEFINGTTITIGKTKIILIPTDKDNLEEFNVPQEWIDIPEWEADYYLPIQLDLEENWLRVWGYTTHQQLKTIGKYSPLEKTYSLEKNDLIEDLNVMLVAREFCDSERVKISELSKIKDIQGEELINNWGRKLHYSPRVLIPFPQWASFIINDDWRESLYQSCLNSDAVNIITTSHDINDNLREDIVENINPIVNHDTTENINPTVNHGITQNVNLITPNMVNKINQNINLIVNNNESKLNNISTPITNKINQNLVKISGWLDDIFEQGWLKADSLFNEENLAFSTRNQSSNFDNEANIINAAKLIDLGIKLGEQSLVLLMACVPNNQGKIAITVQIHPRQGITYLPPNLKLTAMDDEGNLIQEAVISRNADNYIQLKRFSAPIGVKFALEVSLGNIKLRESFIL